MFFEMKSMPMVGYDNDRAYIFCGVKLVADVPCNDGALADVLVSDEHHFEFLDRVSITREADLITHVF